MRREKWSPTRNSRICEDHFLPSDYNFPPAIITEFSCKKYLKRDAIPSIFNFPDRVTKRYKSTYTPPYKSQPEPSTRASPKMNRPEPPACPSPSGSHPDPSTCTSPKRSHPEQPNPCPIPVKTSKPCKPSKNTTKLDHSYASVTSPQELCETYRKRIIEKDNKLRNLRKTKIRLEKNVKGLVSKLKAARLLNKTLSDALRENFALMGTGLIRNGAQNATSSIGLRSPNEYQIVTFVPAQGIQESSPYKGNSTIFQQVEVILPFSFNFFILIQVNKFHTICFSNISNLQY